MPDVSEVIPGASFIQEWGSLANGFYAVAYDVGGQVVLAFRGTDSEVDRSTGWPVGTNLWASDALPIQAQLAAEACRAAMAFTSTGLLIVTGHSLGGGLAGLVATLFDLEAVIFDAMGFQHTAERIYRDALADQYFSHDEGVEPPSYDADYQEIRNAIYGEWPAPVPVIQDSAPNMTKSQMFTLRER